MHHRSLLLSAALLSSPFAVAEAGTPIAHRIVKQPIPPAKNQPQQPSEPLRTATDRKLDIRHIRLDLKVDVEKKTVASQATIDFKAMRSAKSLSLDAMGFDVKKVMFSKDGQAASQAQFTHDGKKLQVELGDGMKAGQLGTVTIEYQIDKPKSGLHFFAPTKADPTIPLQVWSQGQTITNRFWVPCVDEPNQRQTTQVVVTVPAGYEAISNGRLVSRKENADKTVTFDWLQDKPHPSYLITLVVGQFDVVEENWNGTPVLYYVPKGKKAEALPTYGKTRDMLTFFSKRYGVQYPWDKYAQITAYQFGGGMENTSATTMGEFILRDERALLDSTSEGIIAHELAHQWWGDLVTCRDWSHTWLNEGSATYAEALWEEESRGKDEYDYTMYQKANAAIAGGKARPVMDRRYTHPDAMFDGRSYPKGGWVLHMLRNRLGDELFFNGLRQFLTENRLQSVETNDFRRSLERISGRGLERFFYDWLERPGHPDLEVTTEFKADEKKVYLTVKQTQKEDPFHIPLKIALYFKGIAEPVIVEEEMKDREWKFNLAVPGVLERVEVDPDQAVLATIKENKSRELWHSQLKSGTTVPVRLRALQALRNTKEQAEQDLLIAAFQNEKFHGVKLPLASAIGNVTQSAAKDALLAALTDKDARIRSAAVQQLGKYKDDEKVVAAIRDILQKGEPSYGVQGNALRAYAKMGQKDALPLLTSMLDKPSHRDSLAGSALFAIRDLNDPASLDTFITWSAAGKPRALRIRALQGLQELAKNSKVDDKQKQQIVNFYESVLQENDTMVQFNALSGLQQLGTAAKSALPALEKLATELFDGNLKDTVKKTIEKLKEEPKKAEPAEKAEKK